MADFDIDYLAGLARPDIIQTLDFEAILAERKAEFTTLALAAGIDPTVIQKLESSPGGKLLEESSYREIILRTRGNEIARSFLLYYAKGSAIDHLAAYYDAVRIPGEEDARFILRVIMAIQGRSTGGTEPRYKYIAMSSSLRVADAYIYLTPLDPTVHVAIFSTDNNGVADADLLATVRAALGAGDLTSPVRMVNDTIDVRAAVVKTVTATAGIVLLPDAPDSIATDLEASIPARWAAVGTIGRDLTLDWLRAALMIPGVYSATPVFSPPSSAVVAAPYEAVRITSLAVTVTGRNY